MDTSIFLARLLGLYLVLMIIGVLINRIFYQQVIDNIIVSPALIAFQGAMALLGGLAIVLYHNRWAPDWTVLVTILGYWMILQGLVRLWFPLQFTDLIRQLRTGNAIYIILGIMGVIGLFLLYEGFAQDIMALGSSRARR
ncbi:MAG: hypothetical protein Q8K75_00320 [Chlamydiales bacterium]|nr:hypothetical protein [Chlamydiales bacterium]